MFAAEQSLHLTLSFNVGYIRNMVNISTKYYSALKRKSNIYIMIWMKQDYHLKMYLIPVKGGWLNKFIVRESRIVVTRPCRKVDEMSSYRLISFTAWNDDLKDKCQSIAIHNLLTMPTCFSI